MGSIGDFETPIRQRILSTVCVSTKAVQNKHVDTNSLLKQDESNDIIQTPISRNIFERKHRRTCLLNILRLTM